MSINLNKYAQALIKYDTVHVCRDGSSMIPGRGGCSDADLCRSCVPPAHQLVFTVHLSSCYYSNYCISFCLFYFIIKNSTPPAPPLTRARGGTHPAPSKSIPACMCTFYIVLRYLVEHVVGHVEGSQLNLYSPITFRKTS
jgi:hypothetical protein